MQNLTTSKLSQQLEAWSTGIPHEVEFWSSWIKKSGLSWPEDFKSRLDALRPFDQRHADIIRSIGRKSVSVLDVGAGPMTWLGKTIPGINVKITACDPLADIYNRLLDGAGVEAPIKTVFAPVEDLDWTFRASSFDFVHIRNALDHSFDPIVGLIKMLSVCKPGGCVLLSHFANEAERENYVGFHQWNFDVQNSTFVIWNKSHRAVVRDHIGRYASEEVTHTNAGNGIYWVDVLYRRNNRKIPSTPSEELAERNAALMRYLIMQFAQLKQGAAVHAK